MVILVPFLLYCSLCLFGFDKLFGVIDRSHNVVVTRLLHHVFWNHLVYTFHLGIAAHSLAAHLLSINLSLAVSANSWQVVRRWLLSL